ncbi:hypothetical protein, partial [Escherichia coli]|uniref:hypothetical protein n=1 Tax=Escherichia coli TaxID=562 RepID=UPI001AD8A95B
SEDMEDFLERMEIACITNHVVDPSQQMRLLQICLKGNARKWSETVVAKEGNANPIWSGDYGQVKRATYGGVS